MGFFGDQKSGLDPRAFIAVKVDKISDGISSIQPVENMPPGQYCFIDRHDATREAFKNREVELYDFGVKK